MGGICPFDKMPCKYVSSCDEILALDFGLVPPLDCPRAVVKLRRR